MANTDNVKLITKTPRNQDVLSALEEARKAVESDPDAYSIIMFIKSNDNVTRISSGLDNLMELLAILEMAKVDVAAQINKTFQST